MYKVSHGVYALKMMLFTWFSFFQISRLNYFSSAYGISSRHVISCHVMLFALIGIICRQGNILVYMEILLRNLETLSIWVLCGCLRISGGIVKFLVRFGNAATTKSAALSREIAASPYKDIIVTVVPCEPRGRSTCYTRSLSILIGPGFDVAVLIAAVRELTFRREPRPRRAEPRRGSHDDGQPTSKLSFHGKLAPGCIFPYRPLRVGEAAALLPGRGGVTIATNYNCLLILLFAGRAGTIIQSANH